MPQMKEGPLDRLVIGAILTVAGLAIIILHKPIKEARDRWQSRVRLFDYDTMWTGKYTRGGLVFTYAVIILFGAVLLVVGFL
jgi:hypothetical protein